MSNNESYNIYNNFFLKTSTDRLRKTVVRNNLFLKTIDIPGDIVELGVFKGVGVITWLKLLEIYTSGSIKKVIGFDFFSKETKFENEFDHKVMKDQELVSSYKGLKIEDLNNIINNLNLKSKTEFIEGDIMQTVKEYVSNKPGFKISLLHCDLDVGEPTYIALTYLWDKISIGGYIIFDEYACSNWSESEGVDKFLKEKKLKINTLYYTSYPTGYIIKEH